MMDGKVNIRVPWECLDSLMLALREYKEKHPNDLNALILEVKLVPLEDAVPVPQYGNMP